MIQSDRFFPMGSNGHLAFGDLQVRDVLVAGKGARQMSSAGARFTNVVFEKLNVVFSLGGGQVLTSLKNCVFDRCVLRGPGGAGWMNFEGCEFRGCTLRNMILLGSSFVGCKFSGKIVNSVFCASLSANDIKQGVKTKNDIVHNDFTECAFDAVGFRGGVDLERQRLPVDQPGLLCVDGQTAVKALYERFARGKPDTDDLASCVQVLKVKVEDGQKHLYISPTSPFGHKTNVEPILSFLRENGLGREVP
jgi:hypothetical protein